VKKGRNNITNKKDSILQIAMELFLEKGYSATSTNDICAAAKINKPTLYYYFEAAPLF
jgi:AcrR family transcriptional regulator